MNKQLGKLLAAALLLACLPVGVQGTESSQETQPERISPYVGTVVEISLWSLGNDTEDSTTDSLLPGESIRLTNAQDQTLTCIAGEWPSGNMPWKSVNSYVSPIAISVEYSDYYLLDLNLQWMEGRNITISFFLNDRDWISYIVKGRNITSVEFTPDALAVTGQDMNYEAILLQAPRDVKIEVTGSEEYQVYFTQLQEETVQVDTQLAPAAVRLRDYAGQVDLTEQLAPEEIALVNQTLAAPGIDIALPAETEQTSELGAWFLAGAIGAIVVLAAVLVLWRLRRQKRPAPRPESRPGEEPPA